MTSLKINDEKVTNIKEIIKHEVSFYKDLYSSNIIDKNDIKLY